MELEEIGKQAVAEIKEAKDADSLEKIKVKYLGRKQGIITDIFKRLAESDLEEKRKRGPVAQRVKSDIEEAISVRTGEIKGKNEYVDVTVPPKREETGHLHLVTQVENDIRRIFEGMNFSVIDGPEIEEEKYNFDSLNIPADHPAREMWDTFWVKPVSASGEKKSKYLLRTHTSPVQVRYMERHKPPFQIISPGRVFRYEATDASHETNFHQLEGLMIGRGISLANLKFVIEEFFRRFFEGTPVKVQFRSSYFPFVEPGVEVDVKLGDGKWLEMAGAGMVHPSVLKAVKYDPSKWQGFAFGFGIERLIMVKYG
ncbi:MAG: phenylalanine--tRNA ligase subunit alpha, partial [Candidatus Colwellbacteria bacterium]|nr:phenylalanine--tRNA ligase subunit alpha [Candidatus Colwellbacteria bacterium]